VNQLSIFAIRIDLEMIDPFQIFLDEIDQALVWQVAEPNPTPINSMNSMALPFAKANATRTAPLRESLFNDFIGGSFFMWIIPSSE
jgi:hypothetical protein